MIEFSVNVFEMSAIQGQPPKHFGNFSGKAQVLPRLNENIVFPHEKEVVTANVVGINHNISNGKTVLSTMIVSRIPKKDIN